MRPESQNRLSTTNSINPKHNGKGELKETTANPLLVTQLYHNMQFGADKGVKDASDSTFFPTNSAEKRMAADTLWWRTSRSHASASHTTSQNSILSPTSVPTLSSAPVSAQHTAQVVSSTANDVHLAHAAPQAYIPAPDLRLSTNTTVGYAQLGASAHERLNSLAAGATDLLRVGMLPSQQTQRSGAAEIDDRVDALNAFSMGSKCLRAIIASGSGRENRRLSSTSTRPSQNNSSATTFDIRNGINAQSRTPMNHEYKIHDHSIDEYFVSPS